MFVYNSASQSFGIRYIELVIIQIFLFSCLMSSGCKNKESVSFKEVNSVDVVLQKQSLDVNDVAKKSIEKIIVGKLPSSVRDCKYHYKKLGLGVVITYGYFEIPRRDLLSLLGTVKYLPDMSEFGQDIDAIRQFESSEKFVEGMEWWKPSSLNNRQYANKVIFSSNSVLSGYVGLAICLGEIQNDLIGVYLAYQAD
jgi:hypothetical protein